MAIAITGAPINADTLNKWVRGGANDFDGLTIMAAKIVSSGSTYTLTNLVGSGMETAVVRNGAGDVTVSFVAHVPAWATPYFVFVSANLLEELSQIALENMVAGSFQIKISDINEIMFSEGAKILTLYIIVIIKES